jgi:hypothetical protein
LEDYWRKTAEKWHFAEMGYSSASTSLKLGLVARFSGANKLSI